MNTRRVIVPMAIVTAVGFQQLAAGQAAFMPLGDVPGGAFQSQARGVSADGAVVVGQSESGAGIEAFRWTAGGGMIGLGDLPTGSFSSVAYACSVDGSIVLGSGTPDVAGFRVASRWTDAPPTPASLGFAATGGYISVAFAASADGMAACGENVFAPPSGGEPPPLPITQAMRWTSAGGMVDLGAPPGFTLNSGQACTARAMSSDGSVVVGYIHDSAFANHPWRWTQSGGMVDISGGAWIGRAFAVSPEGDVVAGARTVGSLSEPFVWTQAAGRTDPGLLVGNNTGTVSDVSAGGRRLCGTMLISGVSGSNTAVVWDQGLGWRSLVDALAAAGIINTGWLLQFATAMSDDGSVIVGYGVNVSGNTEAFRVVLPLPCRADFNGIGGVTVQDIFDFLGAYFIGSAAADINGVGGVTVQDIFDFLSLYFAGC